jgi:pseudaminic acid synthase
MGGLNASFSMNEQEFIAMVLAVRETEKVIGMVDYTITEKQVNGKNIQDCFM